MFCIRLLHNQHVREHSIVPVNPFGWEIKLEEDRELTRHVRYHDWHRVERALAAFEREVSELRSRGWVEDGPAPVDRAS